MEDEERCETAKLISDCIQNDEDNSSECADLEFCSQTNNSCPGTKICYTKGELIHGSIFRSWVSL